MHLPDGFLNAPTYVATGVAAGAAVGYALYRTRREVGDRVVPLTGVMGACIFAAQMVNFPILWGTSGHLLGGVLAAIVLGPAAGILALSVVLVVQCLLFYDGGPLSLGANILNMAVVGSAGGYAVYSAVRHCVRGPAGHVAGAVIAAWASVMAAAALCSLELWASGTFTLDTVMPAMLIVHALIGLGEALITGSVIAFLVRVRPDLLYAADSVPAPAARWRMVVFSGVATALCIAVVLAPWASASPDGLERVAAELGAPAIEDAAPPRAVPLADYQLPIAGPAWIATSAAGAIGTVVVFLMAFYLARQARRRPTTTL